MQNQRSGGCALLTSSVTCSESNWCDRQYAPQYRQAENP